MTSPITLGLNDALERLGQKNGRLPDLAGIVQPTLLYGDLSSTLATELFDARGHFGWAEAALPAADSAIVQLCPLSAGGAVIEELTLRLDPKGDPARVQFNVFPTIGAFPAPQAFIQLGGVNAIGSVSYNRATGAGFGFGSHLLVDPFPQVTHYPAHIYIPAGGIFQMGIIFGGAPNKVFDGFLVWREMTAIPGRA